MKIYNSDNWFYKLGIVGFNRIMKYNKTYNNLDLEKFNYNVNEDYIEFDVELLHEFPRCYYAYFLNQYNTAKSTSSSLDWNMNRAQDKDKFKDSIKKIKSIVSEKNKKISKLNVIEYERCEDINNQIKNIKYEDLDSLQKLLEEYKQIISEDRINLPITANYFKSIMHKSFFGQESFFNVCHNSKTLKEQEQIVFNDYVSSVIDAERLKEKILIGESSLKEFIIKRYSDVELLKSEKRSDVEKTIKEIHDKLFGKKKKAKDVNEILNKYNRCQMCEENLSYGSDYSDGNFIPLAISNDNSQNMFWDFNTRFPICPLCKLILLCTAAGVSKVYKINREGKHQLYYGFISIDDSITNLIEQNENFNNLNSNNMSFDNYVLDYIDQHEKISLWQLQNILYIEFNADYDSKNSKLNYFNIPVYLAEFLIKHSKELKSIRDFNLRKEVFDVILKNQSLQNFINSKLRTSIKKESNENLYMLTIIKIDNYLKQYKRLCEGGIKEVDDSAQRSLNFIYSQGIKIAEVYRGRNAQNKIPGICYRLLNATKVENKKEIMDTIIRIYMSVEKEIPYVFIDIMKEEKLGYQEIAHSFIAGLNSKEREKKEEK